MSTHTMRDSTNAALLQPPAGDLTGPYPALPYVKAYAELQGHRVRVWDTGIQAFHFLTETSRLQALLDRARSMRAQLETKKFLDPEQQRHYKLLASIVALEINPELVANAVESFQDNRRFGNYRSYKQATRILDAFFQLLSGVYAPTVLTCSEYPTAQEINSFDGVLNHRNASVNPYVAYYEENLFPQLSQYQPSVIGISMEFASQSVQALVLGSLIKERFPGTHVTMGGAYLSQWVLLMGDHHLEWLFTCTDSVICGEGELAFSRLLDHIARGERLEGVPNLMYRDNGRLHRFSQLEYPDIRELPPPDFRDLDLDAYLIPKTIVPYAVSRGCYWGKCAFCQNRYGENRMRRYQTVPVDKALDEMTLLSERHNTNHFNFSNDVLDPRYLERFSMAVIDSGKKFVWNTDLRAEETVTGDLCRLMARAGLNSVAIGFESACQRTLDAMNKGKTVETIRRVMKDLYDCGVATQAMGILGFPGETEHEAALTVSFLEENTDRVSYFVVGLLMVLPGSRLHADPGKYGITSISYVNNVLMAPMPVWMSNSRIPPQAVRHLYHKLGHLEEVYAINEYPYVGALSTNHSFLYFLNGPDILKRLRGRERKPIDNLESILMPGDPKTKKKKLDSLVPRLPLDSAIFTSAFPLEQIQPPRGKPPARLNRFPGIPEDYLLSPSGIVIRLGEGELKVLEGINGKRSLKSILAKFDKAERDIALRVVLNLSSVELILI